MHRKEPLALSPGSPDSYSSTVTNPPVSKFKDFFSKWTKMLAPHSIILTAQRKRQRINMHTDTFRMEKWLVFLWGSWPMRKVNAVATGVQQGYFGFRGLQNAFKL